ncbi:outer membrane beta-barrel protein [Mucilaginibacter sp. UR6-11]|uniref:outer membrane beta-barrel protein n=1 Tax=Mucilaginibacter sp. UR6-11 TaxID=1435644 RepID=UPI001E31CF52|nr:outer membrane beta-barrel protein [Mucilaginibacter sp. UR6-11]MCC8426830.1 outer membrane beta-barrel protein [Mucilaginibacter sp. UR6-11]
MKSIFIPLIFIFLFVGHSYAQTGRGVQGVLIDSTKQTLPGSAVKLKTDLGDSTQIATDADGKFSFSNIKGSKITLYISSFGYQAVIKHYTFSPTDNNTFVIPPIILKSESKQLKEVTIVGVNPIKFKEDTIDYKIAAYPVRENAPVEDVLKKMPGVDVDANGNVSAQGKSITKIRINGKDFMGGDVQSATKNIPADILESVQIIDDYGDQANLTGVKTGEPNKILNFTIRSDKNYGYSLQATAGDGEDALPKAPGVENNNRYIGSVNFFNFKGNRQLTVLGNINNTNTNTFNFGSGGGGGNGGNGGGNGGGGGGGGRGGGPRGGNTGLASTKDGITIARAIGTNYRDQWGKYISVYGSYSFSDNSTFTTTNTLRTNNGSGTTNTNQTSANDNPVNHRFNFNLEYKPDTVNYLKISPTFTYAGTNSSSLEDVNYRSNNVISQAYKTNILSNSTAPSFGINALYNHRFEKRGRNFSLYLNASTGKTNSYSNPVLNYTVGAPNVPLYQVINTDNHTSTFGGNLSYLEPIGKISYLELNYTYSHSYTSNDKETDTLNTANTLDYYARLSNNYNYTFVTNRLGLNFRVIDTKYNYTLGIGVQPSVLDGRSITNNINTHVSQLNYIPTARFIYNFSRNETFSLNYNGSSSQPSFNQLQPVVDLSSASYPVQGNPDLKQQFVNNFSIRYNSFGIASGNILFLNAQFNQINDYVATRTTTYRNLSPAVIAANPDLKNFRNATLTRYLNSDGYYSASAQGLYSKPWDERKYTLIFNGNITYTKYPNFVDSVDVNNVTSATQRNLSKTLTFTPGMRFRLDITNVIDAQASANYSISKTDNSLTGNSSLLQNTNVRSLNLGLTGKNYFGDWTFSYDYTKQLNSGYTIPVTNPNILSVYLERRFLAQNRATIRLAAVDLFNQNTGFSVTSDGASVTQTSVNRLGRYYMITFALRLQKFAGRAPTQDGRGDGPGGDRPRGGGDRQRGGGGGFGGGNGGGGGFN